MTTRPDQYRAWLDALKASMFASWAERGAWEARIDAIESEIRAVSTS